MPTLVTFNGVNYNIPLAGEVGWGDQVNAFLVAVAANALVSGSSVTNLVINNLTTQVETLEETSTVVAAGATVTPNRTNIDLSSLSDVTLNTTTAISDGSAPGQLLILSNTDPTWTIKIQDAANTKMNGDVILSGGENIEFKWDATLKWVEQRRSN